MPRKLKTFVTSLGFFDLAIATSSMKAALDAWGLRQNAFHQGFAHQTDDPKVVEATMAQPGVVLRRPVGTKDEFHENTKLPQSLPATSAPKALIPRKAKARQRKALDAKSKGAQQATVVSFEREKAKRDRARAQDEEKARKLKAHIQRARDKTRLALDEAHRRHEAAITEMDREQTQLDGRKASEEQRWQAQRRKLETELEKARRPT